MGFIKKLLKPMILIPLLVGILLMGLAAYILLAPETWWKPFYVRLEMDETDTAQAEAATQPVEPAMAQPQPMPQQTAPMQMQPGSYVQNGEPAGIMYELSPKVVNLAEPGGFRYLQVSMVLELWPLIDNYYQLQGEERDLAVDQFREKMNTWQPVVDDIVTTTLSSKTFVDIATIEGKQVLKEELMASINELLGYQGVINVYFTEFVVQ
jgi:flagellar basal body-associated protein FliL